MRLSKSMTEFLTSSDTHPLILAKLSALVWGGGLREPAHDSVLLQDLQLVHVHQNLKYVNKWKDESERISSSTMQHYLNVITLHFICEKSCYLLLNRMLLWNVLKHFASVSKKREKRKLLHNDRCYYAKCLRFCVPQRNTVFPSKTFAFSRKDILIIL